MAAKLQEALLLLRRAGPSSSLQMPFSLFLSRVASGAASSASGRLGVSAFGSVATPSAAGPCSNGFRHAWTGAGKVPCWSLTGMMAKPASIQQAAHPGLWQRLLRHKSTTAVPPFQGSLALPAISNSAVLASEALSVGLTTSQRTQLSWWIGGTAAWVYTMVILGGITRLTRSGLSMTEWKFTGERPPLTQEDWGAAFALYQASPEFQMLHSKMTLDEFKFIFWMEYAHRMWGRLLGIAFVIPGAYFAARGYINTALAKRLGLLFFMGGTQGLVGWWMVRSGLKAPEHEWEAPRVSPYRLAAHLVSAFAIFATLTWTTLDLRAPVPLLRGLGEAAGAAGTRARALMLPFAGLVAVTATSGAFVAGMDAGRAYNEWPTMDGQLVPHQYWLLWDMGFGFRNFFENTAAVQFNHRTLAITTATAGLALWTWMRSMPSLPPRALLGMNLVAAVTVAQFSLGVWTLLSYVPVHLGSAHQANALNLFTAVLFTLHALRPANAGILPAALGPLVAPMAMTAVAGAAYAVTQQR